MLAVNSQTGDNSSSGGGGSSGGGPSGWGSRFVLSYCNFTMNTALEADGGALLLSAREASQNDTALQVDALGVLLAANRAATGGGGVSVSGPVSLSLRSSAVQGNVASGGAGGGVAARGCLELSLEQSTVSNNSAFEGSGGGVFAGNCARVLLHDVLVEGNAALAGGGLHLSSDGPMGRAVTDGAGGPAGLLHVHTAAELVQVLVTGNTAAQELGYGNGTAAAMQGRGGGLYVSGAVGVAMVGVDFGGGNTGLLGFSLATTQTCLQQPGRQGAGGNAQGSTPPAGLVGVVNGTRRVSVTRGHRYR